MSSDFIGHISNDRIQSLEDHLKNTAILSMQFADEFGFEDWGFVLGRLHDLGKYSDKFQ